MANVYYCRPWVLRRYATGPLGPHLDGFAGFLKEWGYEYSTGQRYVREVGRFSAWLRRRDLEMEDVNKRVIGRYIRVRWRGLRKKPGQGLFNLLLEYLTRGGLISAAEQPMPKSPADLLLESFTEHLRQDRGLSQETIRCNVRAVRGFLHHRFGKQVAVVARLGPEDVTHYVTSCRNRSWCRAYAGLQVSALRSFFRFLHLRGEISSNPITAIPSVPQWRHATVPSSLDAREVNAVLEQCDRGTAVGRRDYAILLLLARLGLRAIEVRRLRLDDINWCEGHIAIRGKGGTANLLPLPEDVGTALVQYLRHGRPHCADRHVFLRTAAPHRGFHSSSAIGHVVRKALNHSGLRPARMGSHLLRRSCATAMQRSGATLAEIGQILGHRRPDSTAIYAKVDIRQLRFLVSPWPGGAK